MRYNWYATLLSLALNRLSHGECALSRSHRATVLIILSLILIFGVLIRLYDLTRESFWADEGWTMLLAKGPTLADVAHTMADDQHPPLYFMGLNLWMGVFGNSEFMTRLFSTFWSVIGIALVYRLTADAFGSGAGILAALLLAIWDNDIMLARDVRHYSQMATLAVFSALGYVRYLRRPTRTNGLTWFLASVALMYTHYLGALLLGVQALHSLIIVRPWRRVIDLMFRLTAVGLAWSPWALVFIGQAAVRYTRPILYQSTLPNSPETYTLVRGDLLGSQYGLTFALMLLGLCYVMYKNGVAQVRFRPLSAPVFLALWVLIPSAAMVFLNPRFPILTTRNFLLVTPPILILIGHGLMNLDRFARRLILTMLIVVSLFSLDAYLLKPPWRAVAQDMIQNRVSPSEPMLLEVWTDSFALRYHIGRMLNADPDTLPIAVLPLWRETYKENYFAYLLEYLRNQPSFWLAYWGPEQNVLLDWFGDQGYVRTATQVEMHRDERIQVIHYDRPGTNVIARFGDVFALRKAEMNGREFRPGDIVRLNTLWGALTPPGKDYSLSLFILSSAGQLVGQMDGPPFEGRSPTSGWNTDDLHFDSRAVTLPPSLAPGEYVVGLKVYFYADPEPLSVGESNYLEVTRIVVR